MGFDGSLIFDTKLDGTGLTDGLGKLTVSAAKAGAAVAAAVTAGVGAAVKVGMDFEASMSQVAATMGITTQEIAAGSKEFDILKQAAIKAGEATKFNASEAAEALNYLALAGYDASTAADVLPSVLNLAAAGGMELAYASDLATDAMAALGIEASSSNLTHFGDEMAKTAQKSNTSVAQLGEAIIKSAGMVKLAGQSVETMNTALGVLANRGIKGAEGGDKLRNVLQSLTSPTDIAQKAMNRLGLSVTDNQGNIRDLNEILIDMKKALSGMSESARTNILNDIFNRADITAINGLLEGTGEEWNNLKKEISSADGAMQDMADTMNDNLKGRLDEMESVTESLGIAIYEGLDKPLKNAVEDITENISTLVKSVSSGELSGALENVGILLGSTVSSAADIMTVAVKGIISVLSFLGEHLNTIIPILSGVLTAFLAFNALQTITGIISGVSAAFKALNAVCLANPFGAIVAAIAGLVVGLISAYKNCETFRNIVNSVVQAIQTGLAAAFQFLKPYIDAIVSAVGTLASTIHDRLLLAFQFLKPYVDAIVSAFGELVSAIYDRLLQAFQFLKPYIDSIVSVFGTVVSAIRDGLLQAFQSIVEKITEVYNSSLPIVEAIKTYFTMSFENIKIVISTVFEAIKTYISTALTVIKQIIQTVTAAINGDWAAVWNGIESINSTIWDGIESVISTVLKGIENVIKNTLSGIQSMTANVMSVIESNVLNSVENLKNTIQSLPDTLSNIASGFVQFGANIIEGIKSGIASVGSNIPTAISSICENAKQNASNIASGFMQVGSNIIERIIAGITSIGNNIATTISRVCENAKQAVGNIVSGYVQIGSNIVSGIVSGITGAASSVVSAMVNLAKNALAAAKSALGIHSPSRVMRDEVGKMLVEGMIVGITSKMDEVPELFKNLVDDIKLQLDIGAINDAEYYKKLEQHRDEYLTKGSDEWWKYTKDILKYETELEEKQRDKEFKRLEQFKDLRLISEQQYYNALENMRDKYFEKGSDEWEEYTLEIMQYYSDNIYDSLTKQAEEIADKQSTLKDKLLSGLELFQSGTLTRNISGDMAAEMFGPGMYSDSVEYTIDFTKINDLEVYKNQLKDYYNTLNSLKSQVDMPSGLFEEIIGMDMYTGQQFMQQLLQMSDNELQKYISDYNEIQNMSDNLSKEFYKSEAEGITEAAEIFGETYLDTVADKLDGLDVIMKAAGFESAAAFTEQFKAQIREAMEEIRYIVSGAAATPAYAMASGGEQHNTYILSGSGETVSQQLRACRDAAKVEEMRGIK